MSAKAKAPILRVFVSSTSADLAPYREIARKVLTRDDCLPVEQTDFTAAFKTVPEILREKIETCDAIIHIVGECYGQEPAIRTDPRRSFTQLEHEIARELKLPIIRFICTSEFPYNPHSPESPEKQALQAAYRKYLQDGEGNDFAHTWVKDREELREQLIYAVRYLRDSILSPDEKEFKPKVKPVVPPVPSPVSISKVPPVDASLPNFLFDEIGGLTVSGGVTNVNFPWTSSPLPERPAPIPAPPQVRVSTPPPPPPALAIGKARALTLPGGVPLELLPVAPGTFLMGSPTDEPERFSDETQHSVRITKPYWLGKFPVTQAQWQAVMGSNPSFSEGAQCPVENVSWDDATAFCEKVTNQERTAGRLPEGYYYTLPTEAQWEYACRAGTTGAYSGSGKLDEMGWYDGNSSSTTHDVGGKSPSAWGFYDMHGNVFEWCLDWGDIYPNGSVTDPAGPAAGSFRVLRGGSWNFSSGHCRSANRYNSDPGGRSSLYGFRVALAPASVR
jgi:formylglycine-generating enzyme required for sulfatase activity